jgi:transcriptional regulator with XRE-family HTH domain
MDATELAEFGHRLRRARLALELSRAALAVRAGIARNTLTALERGLQHPEPTTLAALARALQVPEHELTNAPPGGVVDPRLAHLNEEDRRVAQAFHHAPTEMKTRVLRALQEPATRADAVALNELAERLAHLDPGQLAAVMRLITEFERMLVPPAMPPGRDRADEHGRGLSSSSSLPPPPQKSGGK